MYLSISYSIGNMLVNRTYTHEITVHHGDGIFFPAPHRPTLKRQVDHLALALDLCYSGSKKPPHSSVENERKISMSSLDSIREVRIVLTVERFDQAVQFYRDRLGLAVVEQWQRAEGSGVILALGPHTTLELFDAPQAAFVDQMEAGRRVRGPGRLAHSVLDAETDAAAFHHAGAQVTSHPKPLASG